MHPQGARGLPRSARTRTSNSVTSIGKRKMAVQTQHEAPLFTPAVESVSMSVRSFEGCRAKKVDSASAVLRGRSMWRRCVAPGRSKGSTLGSQASRRSRRS